MKSWIPTKKIIIFSFSLLFLAFVLYFSSLLLLNREVNRLKFSYSDTKLKVVENERVSQINAVLKENNFYIDNLNAFFISEGDEVVFIEEIEKEAKKNLSFFEIESISKNQSDTKFKEDVLVRLKMQGTWNGTMNFVDSLEKMSFGVLPINFVLNKQDNQWSSSLDLLVFREK